MRRTVLIAFTDAALEAAAVRGAAEAFGASVYYYPIGRPDDFLRLLAGETGAAAPSRTGRSFRNTCFRNGMRKRITRIHFVRMTYRTVSAHRATMAT